MVEGEGFEPSKAEPSDLQSDPFDRSGTPPTESPIMEISLVDVNDFSKYFTPGTLETESSGRCINIRRLVLWASFHKE